MVLASKRERPIGCVVDITQLDIANARDTVKALNVVAEVMQWGDYACPPAAFQALRTWPPADFQTWREAFHVFLLCNVSRTADQPAPVIKFRELQIVPLVARGGDVQLSVLGSLSDVLWFQMLDLLRASGLRRIFRCECGRVFIKVGRREFCSERCQKRVYMRNIRARDRAQTSKGSRRHGKTKTRTR